MHGKRYSLFLTMILLTFLAIMQSCQKDSEVQVPLTNEVKPKSNSIALNSGNYLASSGILTIKIKDSTYTFNASRDSIAFISVSTGDSSYFGITAINKEHTMSFGVSSPGVVNTNSANNIAGSQFLLVPTETEPGIQYSLSKYTGQKNFGNINVAQFKQGNLLAKGTFFTYLAKDDEAGSPYYKASGSFNLQFK